MAIYKIPEDVKDDYIYMICINKMDVTNPGKYIKFVLYGFMARLAAVYIV